MKDNIKKIYIIENYTVNSYRFVKTNASNMGYIYSTVNGNKTISQGEGNAFLSEIVALSVLEERLKIALSNIRIIIKTKQNSFLGTKDIDSFKKSVQNMTIEEIEQEITGINLSDLLVDGDNTIYKKRL